MDHNISESEKDGNGISDTIPVFFYSVRIPAVFFNSQKSGYAVASYLIQLSQPSSSSDKI